MKLGVMSQVDFLPDHEDGRWGDKLVETITWEFRNLTILTTWMQGDSKVSQSGHF